MAHSPFGQYTIDQNIEGSILYANDGNLIDNKTGKGIVLETRVDIPVIEQIALSLGLVTSTTGAVNIALSKVSIRDILAGLMAIALKKQKLVPGVFTQKKQFKYGEVIFGLYHDAVVGSGKISSRSSNRRWLAEKDTLNLESKLFKKSGYQNNNHSMKYTPTALMDELMLEVWEHFKSIDFVDNKISHKELDITVDIQLLMKIGLRDSMVVLSSCIGYDNGFIIRPIIKDQQNSRVYSYITSISSDSRKLLGLIEYDMGTAQQTIAMSIVSDRSKYPLHEELLLDKHSFRSKIAVEADKDLAWAKKQLNVLGNLPSAKKVIKGKLLKEFYKEAQALRMDFMLSITEEMNRIATRHASPNIIPVFNINGEIIGFEEDGKKQSSIYFFGWTQIERIIRELMMSCFENPVHQVHDAVWSFEDIDTKILEQAVLDATGMEVKISRG